MDRRPVIALTDGAYYSIPVLVDAERSPAVVVYEARDDGQDVARYVDQKYSLGVFPAHLAGLHEPGAVRGGAGGGHRLPPQRRLLPAFAAGRGGAHDVRPAQGAQVRAGVRAAVAGAGPQLRARLAELLAPLEEMLSRGPFLLGKQPVYADYALHGVLGNYTYSAQNRLPEGLTRLAQWYDTLPGVRLPYRPD